MSIKLMRVEDVKKVAVVGAGIMGHGIAQVFAQGGYAVNLCDINYDILHKALFLIRSNLDTFIEHGLSTKEAKKGALSKINVTTNLAGAVGEADFIVEAILEVLDLKKQIFRSIEEHCPKHAIIASNTSGLSITEIGSLCERQENLIITHFFNPPYIMPVVEVVKGAKTSEETIDFTCALLEKLGKKPVKILKAIPGFIANRIQFAMFREALALLEAGIASAEDIDTAVKGTFGFRLPTIGPFETADLGGLDTWLKIAEDLFAKIDCSREPPLLLKEKVRQGKLGAKAGEGFYKYDKGLLDAKVKERDSQFLERLKQLYLRKG